MGGAADGSDEEVGASGAGRLLGLSAERVRQLADAGQLKARMTGLGRLFRVDDVERLARERRTRTGGSGGGSKGAR